MEHTIRYQPPRSPSGTFCDLSPSSFDHPFDCIFCNRHEHGFADRFSESDRWAAPIVFGPRTLLRTWGTRPIPPTLAMTRALSKNISKKGPRNCRSLGFARDDKGEGDLSVESGF